MGKISMMCPFSNKVCMECVVYRGRHFYLCSGKGDRGYKRDMSQYSSIELRKAHGKEDKVFKKLMDTPSRQRMISNVEDLIEGEEFSRFK
jgi:hypothetical protein